MVKESIIIKQVENIKANGLMIKNMDSVWYNMLMVIDIKVIGRMAKELTKVYINIQMVTYIKGNGEMILKKATVN